MHKVEDIVEPAYRILRVRLSNEFLVLNNLSLASILARDSAELNTLKDNLPAFTIILCLSGLNRYPEDKIAYEEDVLKDTASQVHFDFSNTVAGIPGLQETVLKLLRSSWSGETYWKFRYKGARHDIFFHTTLDRVPEFTRAMAEVATEYGYPATDITVYIQPKEHGRACYCEYGFSCDPNNTKECARVRGLFMAASERAMSMGGLFSNPYGPWADMVYSRAHTYADTLKTIKGVVDPNKILNPGKLCF